MAPQDSTWTAISEKDIENKVTVVKWTGDGGGGHEKGEGDCGVQTAIYKINELRVRSVRHTE